MQHGHPEKHGKGLCCLLLPCQDMADVKLCAAEGATCAGRADLVLLPLPKKGCTPTLDSHWRGLGEVMYWVWPP